MYFQSNVVIYTHELINALPWTIALVKLYRGNLERQKGELSNIGVNSYGTAILIGHRYDIMYSTWNESPCDRPTFEQLVCSLTNLHKSIAGEREHAYHTLEGSKANEHLLLEKEASLSPVEVEQVPALTASLQLSENDLLPPSPSPHSSNTSLVEESRDTEYHVLSEN